MAKKINEVSEEVENQVKTEKYFLTETVKESGYFANLPTEEGSAKLDNFQVSKGRRQPTRDRNTGNMVKKYIMGSVIENEKETGKDYFENLTDFQIHILAQAGVIVLNKEQGQKYNSWLEGVYKNRR
jgi:hypothetical protein